MEKDDPGLTQLINSWAAGDTGAGNALFTCLMADLRRSAHRNLRSDAGVRWDTTEVVSETFLKLSAQRVPQWDNRQHFLAVIEILMKRCILEGLRHAGRQRRDYRLEVDVDAALTVPGASFCEEAAELDAAMAELRQRDAIKAEVFERRAIRGETLQEVAAALERPLSTVRRHFEVARAWLKVRVAEGAAAADPLRGAGAA